MMGYSSFGSCLLACVLGRLRIKVRCTIHYKDVVSFVMLIYIDDTTVFSSFVDEHLEHLRLVFD